MEEEIYLVSTTIGHVLDISKANGAKLSKTMINVNTNSWPTNKITLQLMQFLLTHAHILNNPGIQAKYATGNQR